MVVLARSTIFLLHLCSLGVSWTRAEEFAEYEGLALATLDFSDDADREVNPLRRDKLQVQTVPTTAVRSPPPSLSSSPLSSSLPPNVLAFPNAKSEISPKNTKHIVQFLDNHPHVRKSLAVGLTQVLVDLGYLASDLAFTNAETVSMAPLVEAFAKDYGLNWKEVNTINPGLVPWVPRCGTTVSQIRKSRDQPLKSAYTYTVNFQNPGAVNTSRLESATRQAFAIFSNSSGIPFTEVASQEEKVDIEVFFVTGMVSVAQEFFVGRDQVGVAAKKRQLVKQFFNGSFTFQLVDVIFIEYRQCWSEVIREGPCGQAQLSLVRTLLHQLGHVLGFEHNHTKSSFMYPFFGVGPGNLTENDTELIQAGVSVHRKNIRKPERQDANVYAPSLALCDGTLDRFFYLNQMIYITKGNLVWVMNATNKQLLSTLPTNLQTLFPLFSHKRLDCLYTGTAGNPVGSYEGQFYNLLTGERFPIPAKPKFCVPVSAYHYGSVNNGYIVLADVANTSVKGETRLNDKSPTAVHTSTLDYILYVPSDKYYYFTNGSLWAMKDFSFKVSVENQTLHRIQDYWFKPYCGESVQVSLRGLHHVIDSAFSLTNYLKSLIEKPELRLREPTPIVHIPSDLH